MKFQPTKYHRNVSTDSSVPGQLRHWSAAREESAGGGGVQPLQAHTQERSVPAAPAAAGKHGQPADRRDGEDFKHPPNSEFVV